MRADATRTESESAQKILTWAFLAAFVLLVSVGRGVSEATGAELAHLDLLASWGFNWLGWHWIVAQNRPHRATYALDTGWLTMLAWAPVAAYFLWRFERWRGLAKVALVLGLWVAGFAVSTAIRLGWSLLVGFGAD